MGPDFSIWQDMPTEPGQLALFRGKAALPTHALGISSFSKAFFLHPGTEQLYGRVLLGKGPLGDALYPLYFKASVGPSVVPSESRPPAAPAPAARLRRSTCCAVLCCAVLCCAVLQGPVLKCL